ncbi:hypothetical protein M406DRAFT_328256 [Cryphonectria parasitica EP155]|uniref:Uncharacterized protein n=1 Tax=Cryphonectria parasitica (strain ATCC 38755 / EP155) TaxID=660469 RepID=A0A9P4Y6T5_CRYP1|nr:uncharacterized protein M406DRAFT_328256 [Cryphonectria parasitica EP155]KAF3767160.1 hypothetical protein M406DRAFT_328256 [Cryphonectria parasitica EP155]
MAPQPTLKRGETALVKNRGSGFEDGFADPPMTPAEYAIEKEIYDPPFHERIEECIQRFVARRRLTQDRNVLFQKYLALGGIESAQRQFTGTADLVKEWKNDDYTADEIRAFTANNFVSDDSGAKGKWFDPYYPEHWDVDFAGVVAGFLGSYLPEQGGPNTPQISLAADTVLNFLKYVRHHDVCPEYDENLAEATHICELALTELPHIAAAGYKMPGDFNLACRILFYSSGKPINKHENIGLEDQSLVMYEDKKFVRSSGEMVKLPGSINNMVFAPADFDAESVFKTTVVLHEPDLVGRVLEMDTKPLHLIDTFQNSYEVRDIVFADPSIANLYGGLPAHSSSTRPITPTGYMVLHPIIIEDGWDKRPTHASGRASNSEKPVSVYMEHVVLEHLTVGMKMRLAICELDIGIQFIKDVIDVLPSFYVFLPQSLMLDWKPPRPETRPPPSADDPDVADRREQEGLEREERETVKEQRKVDPDLDQQMREVEDAQALQKAMERARI